MPYITLPLQYLTIHYISLPCITLQYLITLYYITLPYLTHYITFHNLQYITLHFTLHIRCIVVLIAYAMWGESISITKNIISYYLETVKEIRLEF